MLIDFKNVTKKFLLPKKQVMGKAEMFKALDQVSFSVREGENCGIAGESGCGKTTLARIFLKLISHDEGVIDFNGVNIGSLNRTGTRKFRRDVQMVFQDPYSSLDPRFTVRRLMDEAFTLAPKGSVSRQEKSERMVRMLTDVKLPNKILSRYPHEFSGGERQRIAIARALLLNPKCLVLDEATSSLDVIVQKEILELLAQLQKKYKLTYVFISHDLKVVKKVCQQVVIMQKGKVVECAPTADIFNNPQEAYTKQLLAAALDYRVNE
ncbi:ATP-binding cassette domain-containing protein [Candidatus Omnitrophota bacterium]